MKVIIIIFVALFSFLNASSTQISSFFAPEDSPCQKLVELIKSTKKSIVAAVYCLTDKRVSGALIEAYSKGIDIKIIVDQISTSRYGKADALATAGLPVLVYCPRSDSKWQEDPLMHHKFAVFDNDIVWTGSFNWTVSGNESNKENVVLITNRLLANRFKQKFTELSSMCVPFARFKSVNESALRQQISKLLKEYNSDAELASKIQALIGVYHSRVAKTTRAGAASRSGSDKGKHIRRYLPAGTSRKRNPSRTRTP